MAAYDPRMMFHMHGGMHPNVLANPAQRYPHPGPSVPNIQAVSAPQQRQGVPSADLKREVGPGWENTYRTAQNIAFPDIKAACGERVGEFVEDLARGIGCPVENILVPLLPCVGGLLGTNTTIRVHRAWTEPPVVWSIVGASSGSRRSAVIRQLLAPMLGLQAHKNKEAASAAQTQATSTSLSHACSYENTNSVDDNNEKGATKRGSHKNVNHMRALYSGTRLTLAGLTEVLHRNDGHAFSLTENVYSLHEVLGLTQPAIPHRLVSAMEEMYEGLPNVGVEDGRTTTIIGSNFNHGVTIYCCDGEHPLRRAGGLDFTARGNWFNPRCGQIGSSQFRLRFYSGMRCSPSESNGKLLPYNAQKITIQPIRLESDKQRPEKGFASPEYVVTLMVKSPPWLSARLLLSCPQADDMKGVFGEPSTCTDLPDLDNIYSILLDQHKERQIYSFDSDAIQELSKFFDEEWSTVLNQLDQNEHEGIIGKSMGQIVRLSGVLKALDNSVIVASGIKGDYDDWDWTINVEVVKWAITLGKYFLEQKLAMTFMVGTGFFSHSSDNFTDNSINDNSNQATTLPQTAVQDSPDGPYQSSPFSNSKSSSSHTPSPVAPTGTSRSLNQNPNPSSSEQPPNLPFGLPKLPGDVDFSTLPHTMTTVEEDVSEMMQAVDFVHFSKTQFVAVHGRRIKRLLECYDDGHGVSATTAAQKSITPPVRIEGTNNRHPAWASALFFQKVAELELGTAQQGRHPTNRKVCWRFRRKPISELSEKDFQLLQYLRVEMDKYSQFGSGPFNPSMIVNSGLISLPSNSPGHHHLSTMNSGGSSRINMMDEDSTSQTSPQNIGTPNIKTEVF